MIWFLITLNILTGAACLGGLFQLQRRQEARQRIQQEGHKDLLNSFGKYADLKHSQQNELLTDLYKQLEHLKRMSTGHHPQALSPPSENKDRDPYMNLMTNATPQKRGEVVFDAIGGWRQHPAVERWCVVKDASSGFDAFWAVGLTDSAVIYSPIRRNQHNRVYLALRKNAPRAQGSLISWQDVNTTCRQIPFGARGKIMEVFSDDDFNEEVDISERFPPMVTAAPSVVSSIVACREVLKTAPKESEAFQNAEQYLHEASITESPSSWFRNFRCCKRSPGAQQFYQEFAKDWDQAFLDGLYEAEQVDWRYDWMPSVVDP